jgi:hypothetical protein
MSNHIVDVFSLKKMILEEFSDIVSDIDIPFVNEMRISLIDKSFIDVWFSIRLKNRYSYHWERMNIDGLIFRHDNAPHLSWKDLLTFPKHFHNGSEKQVEESNISNNPHEALSEFLNFARTFLDTK